MPHDLTVRSIYVLSVDLYDGQTKKPLTVSQGFLYGSGFRITHRGTDLAVADAAMSARGFLANCSAPPRAGAYSVDTYRFSDSDLPEAGPIQVKIAFPGYEPWNGSLNARRIAVGLERQRVELVPIVSGFGVLVLGLPSGMRHRAPQADLFTATLTLASARGKGIQFKVDPDESGQVTYEGIPFGTYSVSLSGFCQGGGYPGPGDKPLTVEISDRPATVEIPEMHLSSMCMDPRRPDGSAYVGYLDVLVLQGADPVGGFKGVKTLATARVFLGPPYRVDLLVPGDYTLVPKYPPGLEPCVVFTLGPDSETQCTFHVP